MLIDVTRLVDRLMQGRLPTGVDRVSLEYVRHYGSVAQALIRFAGRWIVLGRVDSASLFADLLSVPEHFVWRVRWWVAKRLPMPMPSRLTGRLLLNTGHSGLDQADYGLRIQRYGLRAILFVHDLIPVSHPEYCRPGEDERHRRRLDTVLNNGYAVVVNSHATKEELLAYAANRKQSVPPCIVAPLAPPEWPDATMPPLLNAPYFVMLGTIEPRKNHFLILHLWRELAEEMGSAAPRLVVIGQRGWECEQVVDLLDRCTALRGLVVEKPRCDDVELVTWLNHAQALLFPSFIEGFGLPLIEALMLGLPVIASDLPVFHEIAGPIPEYLDPLDGQGWKRAILDYARPDSVRRQAQRERLRGYQPPTWDDHIAKVGKLIEAVMRRV